MDLTEATRCTVVEKFEFLTVEGTYITISNRWILSTGFFILGADLQGNTSTAREVLLNKTLIHFLEATTVVV